MAPLSLSAAAGQMRSDSTQGWSTSARKTVVTLAASRTLSQNEMAITTAAIKALPAASELCLLHQQCNASTFVLITAARMKAIHLANNWRRLIVKPGIAVVPCRLACCKSWRKRRMDWCSDHRCGNGSGLGVMWSVGEGEAGRNIMRVGGERVVVC